jgi:hypothetical protein
MTPTGALTITNQHTARDTWFAFGPPYLAERRKWYIWMKPAIVGA